MVTVITGTAPTEATITATTTTTWKQHYQVIWLLALMKLLGSDGDHSSGSGVNDESQRLTYIQTLCLIVDTVSSSLTTTTSATGFKIVSCHMPK